jgi:hypothetical protein
MTTRTIADFVPFVELEAQGAAQPNIQHAVREAVIYFMRNTRAAVGEMFIDMSACQEDAALLTDECHRLVWVESVWLAPDCNKHRWTPDWERIAATTLDQRLFHMMPGYWVDDVGGPQTTLWLRTRRDKAPRTICVRYNWAIGRDACEVPSWIYDDYADVITNGALAYLHRNPDDASMSKPFVAVVGTPFYDAVERLRNRKKAGYNSRSQPVIHRWGRTG